MIPDQDVLMRQINANGWKIQSMRPPDTTALSGWASAYRREHGSVTRVRWIITLHKGQLHCTNPNYTIHKANP